MEAPEVGDRGHVHVARIPHGDETHDDGRHGQNVEHLVEEKPSREEKTPYKKICGLCSHRMK